MATGVQAQVNQDTPGWFEFVVPGLDASETPVDMSFLNPEPAGTTGFVEVEGAHFVDGSGKQLRFLGTNLTFDSAFPDKAVAAKVAAHMRKLGLNIVRFHHLDNRTAPGGIWLPGQEGFDPEQIDKLDWMVYQLKQHGIYTNLNLHVSRNYPGLPDDIRTFQYGKMLDHFYRPFIEMQKEYARELLMHRNPYTNTVYVREPAAAFVEINNENTLLRSWGDLLDMPDPYRSALMEQWHSWLRERYADTASLRQDWQVAHEPLGDELLLNTDFAEGTNHWTMERGTTADATFKISQDGPNGDNCLHVTTLKPGQQSWNLQVHQLSITLQDDAPYTLSFWGKSDEIRQIGVGVRLQQAPWRFVGLQTNTQLTTEWQRFEFVFQAREAEPSLTRLDLGLRNQIGQFWFAGVSLRRGGNIGLPEDQTLEAGNIAFPPVDAPTNMRQSFWEFLVDVEMSYSEEMVRFLRDELSIRQPVSVTQASYGGLAGVRREAELADFVDMHSYWQHPRFPNRPWSRTDWNILNTPMVNDANGGTLTRLAFHRVEGKPFTVSEYDHPAPSDYSAEMFPMIASFAALQDWDGLYQFSYGGKDWDRQRISGYFAINGHPGKLVFLPISVVMFRMGGVSAASETVLMSVPPQEIVPQLTRHDTNARATWEEAGASPLLPMVRKVAAQFNGDEIRLSGGPGDVPVEIESCTGEIVWNQSNPERGIYTVNTAQVQAAVGYLGGQTITLGDITIEMPVTDTNWASIAMAALDGMPIRESGRILLAAVGRVENTDMGWNAERTSVTDKWGEEPTVAEGIPATITLMDIEGRQIHALDGTGTPKGEVRAEPVDGGTRFCIGAEYETLWYLVSQR